MTTRDFYPVNLSWEIIEQHRGLVGEQYEYEDARFLLQLCLMVTDSNLFRRPLTFPARMEVVPLNYDHCPSVLLGRGLASSPMSRADNLGYLLYRPELNQLIIVFSGTTNFCLAELDMNYRQVELEQLLGYQAGVKGHGGIYAAYLAIRLLILRSFLNYYREGTQVIIIGHSLGGALSQLCALDLSYYQPYHYSFASPLLFNPLGGALFDHLVKRSYRIANSCDLVTLCPLPVMPNGDLFVHVGELINFQSHRGSYTANHSLSYLEQYNLH